MLKTRLDELIDECEQHYSNAFDDHDALLPRTLRLMIDLAKESKRMVVPTERFRWIAEKLEVSEARTSLGGQPLIGGGSRTVTKEFRILQYMDFESGKWKDVPIVANWGIGQIQLPPAGLSHANYERLKKQRFESDNETFKNEYQQEFKEKDEK